MSVGGTEVEDERGNVVRGSGLHPKADNYSTILRLNGKVDLLNARSAGLDRHSFCSNCTDLQ